MTPDDPFVRAFDRLPLGGFGATFEGKRYRITKTIMANGRSQKLEAEELGGPDYISFNLYRFAGGGVLLKPCEMSEEKVTAFVLGADAD